MKDSKTIDELIIYLNNQGIDINETNKNDLINIGYFHGYKGYRYIKKPHNRINFSSFNELLAIINFDNKVKSLLYPEVMFIETAMKNRVLENFISKSNVKTLSDLYTKLMTDYKYFSNTNKEKYKDAYKKRLETYNKIQSSISSAYNSDSNVISHYIQKDEPIPIWAIFEILSLGEFGNIISTLNASSRKSISKDMNFNIAFDSEGIMVQSIIFTLKDLRNAIAHNNIIFDTRFKTRKIKETISKYIKNDININQLNFNSLADYLILIVFLLNKFGKCNNELNAIIDTYIQYALELQESIPQKYYDQIILTGDINKLSELKKFINI